MIFKRPFRAVSEYVQSELLYSSLEPVQPSTTSSVQLNGQKDQCKDQPRSPLPTSTFAPPGPDPQLMTHFQQRERVYAFIRVPLSLEKFMLFAFWLCVDTFLTMFTFLPIRLMFCAFNFLSRPLGLIFPNWNRSLSPAQRCDFLRGVVIVFCSTIVCQLDISVFYHLIRSQSIIKLYIFFNMLEIAEKLMASVGQDIMDALFITATEQTFTKFRSRYLVLIFHVALAVIYSCIHTVIFTLQAVTLNVAFNSQNKSLLTVMISNNFVEIKSNVFRKYSKNNLYQVACADARERFHLFVMMSIVAVRNMAQYHWQLDHLMALLPDMAIVLTAEVFVDWIKHCFITKFNETSSEVYVELRTSLARHVLTASVASGGADRQDTVANRTGLSLVPLSCLIIIVGSQALKSAEWNGTDPLFIALLAMSVFVLKSILGYIVISVARSIVVQASQIAAINLSHSHGNGRYVGGHHGRSYSVEDVKFEVSKPTSNVTTPASLSPKLSHVNNALKQMANEGENIGSNDCSFIPQKGNMNSPVLSARQCWPENELRRARSIGDLSTIYESGDLACRQLPCRKFVFAPGDNSSECLGGKSSKID